MRQLSILILVIFSIISLPAQGQLFGLKGGITMGTQKWNTYERDPLFASHFAVSVESAEVNRKSALYGQIGYHTKGSAIRVQRFFDINGNEYKPDATDFRFNNIGLQVGVKQIFGQDSENSRLFWRAGIRGEYTLSTNLKEFDNQINFSFPRDAWVNKITYGISFGGGYEFYLRDLVRGVVELNIGYDLSNQYEQPPLMGIPNPNRPGETIDLGERNISNTVIELSVGVLLWRKIEFID